MFFSLIWYDDMTYALDTELGFGKTLSTSCCNRSSCQSIEPKFLQREHFIDSLPIKYTKTNWKWFVYCIVPLKK